MLRRYLIEFLVFCRCLLQYAQYVRGILIGLLILIFSFGIVLAFVEDMPISDGIYFAFVTGLTIGYGDISPETHCGRVISLGVGFIGILFTGLYIAVATRALADTHSHFSYAVDESDDPTANQG